MKMISRLIKVTFLSCIWAFTASAHVGGMDRYGGHNDLKAGGFLFHNGPFSERTHHSLVEAIRALNQENRKESAPESLPESWDRSASMAAGEKPLLVRRKIHRNQKEIRLTMDAAESGAILKIYESCESFEMAKLDYN